MWRSYWKQEGLCCPEPAPPLPPPGLGGPREKETLRNALHIAVAFASLGEGCQGHCGNGDHVYVYAWVLACVWVREGCVCVCAQKGGACLQNSVALIGWLPGG